MYRFLLYSLILHVFIIAILFASTLFTPKPKNIQIKLAVLSKSNNVKKTLTESPAEKKETPEEQQKKAEEVQKLLDNVLKEDITTKAIEKTIIKPTKAKTNPKESLVNKKKATPKKLVSEIIPVPNTVKKLSEPIVSPKDSSKNSEKNKDTNQIITDLSSKTEAVKDTQKVETSNPYSNPILPQQNNQPENNPYENPVIHQESIDNAVILPSIRPARKEIDVSKIKDNNVGEEASRIANDSSGISNNIMSNEAFYLNNYDKRSLMNQMSQCLASLGMIRENNESITLLIEMKEDAKIKDINVIKNNKIIPKSELSNLETRVIYLFNNPKCSKLILPKGKFNYWKKFTIKLNLKGLFE